MTYELGFLKPALREWRKLGATIQKQFKAKLAERQKAPRVQADRLRGYTNHYKIKLRASGYRLVYEVRDAQAVIVVVAIGKRERGDVYRAAANRTDKSEGSD